MKKVLIMLVMLFTVSAHSFASAVNIAKTAKYNFKINNSKLAYVLKLSDEQIELSDSIMKELERGMEFAETMETDESREMVAMNAIKKNIYEMHYTLDGKQYKQYVTILNQTLKNKGFDVSKFND